MSYSYGSSLKCFLSFQFKYVFFSFCKLVEEKEEVISFLCLFNSFLLTCDEANKTTNQVSFKNMSQLNKCCVRELERQVPLLTGKTFWDTDSNNKLATLNSPWTSWSMQKYSSSGIYNGFLLHDAVYFHYKLLSRQTDLASHILAVTVWENSSTTDFI